MANFNEIKIGDNVIISVHGLYSITSYGTTWIVKRKHEKYVELSNNKNNYPNFDIPYEHFDKIYYKDYYTLNSVLNNIQKGIK